MDTKEALWPVTESPQQTADSANAEKAEQPKQRQWLPIALGIVVLAVLGAVLTATLILVSTSDDGAAPVQTPYEDAIVRQARNQTARSAEVDSSPGYLEKQAFSSSEVTPPATSYADLIVRQGSLYQDMIERSMSLRSERSFLTSEVTPAATPYEDLIVRQAKNRSSAVDASSGYLEERAFFETTN